MTRRTAIVTPLALAAAAPGLADLLSSKEPLTWVFTGDSITHGAAHTYGGRSYSEHFAERLRWEMRRSRDIVINTGISGDRLPRMLADIDWRVLRFEPKVVSLMFGMNDCLAGPAGRETFANALVTCWEKLKAKGIRVVLHTPNLIHYPADPARQDLLAYVDLIRKFANDKPVMLVDHYEHWMKSRKSAYELLMLLADGAIHPNQFGHIELARETFRRLGIDDPQSRTGRLFVP